MVQDREGQLAAIVGVTEKEIHTRRWEAGKYWNSSAYWTHKQFDSRGFVLKSRKMYKGAL
jgi:hypothetical protein